MPFSRLSRKRLMPEGGGRVPGTCLASARVWWAGFEVINLGTNTGPEKSAGAVHARGAVGRQVSPADNDDAEHEADAESAGGSGGAAQAKMMVGGAPVTDVFAKEICANGYAPDASRAVALAKALL